MSIDALSSVTTTNLWQLLEATTSTASTTRSETNAASSVVEVTSASDSSTLSGRGELFSQLEQLSKSNPSEFKKITAEIADQLQAAAKNSNDPAEANFLNQMASNFAKASQSGKFSDLFPSQPTAGAVTASATGADSLQKPASGHPPSSDSSDTTSVGSGSSTSTSSSNAYSSSSSSGAPVAAIFAQALQQIQTDLGSSTSSSNS